MNKLVLPTLGLIWLTTSIHAAEGGSSSYLQGTYGDFAAGALGSPGVYARNELIYYEASVALRSLGRPVDGELQQSLWGDLLKLAYISDRKFLGGTFNSNLAIPLLFGSKVTVMRPGQAPRVASDGDVSGLGDLYVTPAALGWNFGRHHVNANLSAVVPTGSYEEERTLNPGRNYWSLDPTINYTWLHKRGHEVSITAGYMRNWENRSARYTTGDEVHVDWLVAQHFSPRFALGVTGYWYDQVSDDSGALSDGSGSEFNAQGAGIGAALLYSASISRMELSMIAKWVRDVHDENRLGGDVASFGISFKL